MLSLRVVYKRGVYIVLGYHIDWACHIEGGCYFWCRCFISRGGHYIDRSGFI